MKLPEKRMPNAERAKIFMPFDALRGLSAALRQAELTAERRIQAAERGDAVHDEALR